MGFRLYYLTHADDLTRTVYCRAVGIVLAGGGRVRQAARLAKEWGR